MKNFKKPTGGEYYDNLYESNYPKQNYFNATRDQESHSFSKNQTFDPNYNWNSKGNPKRQDQKNFNNKRDNEKLDRKNNENFSNNVNFKSSGNSQNKEIDNFNWSKNKNQSDDTYFNSYNNNQQTSTKAFKNNQTSQFNQEDQVFQHQSFNKYQNKNYNQSNKAFHNKRNYNRNNNNLNYSTQEKNYVETNTAQTTKILETENCPSNNGFNMNNEEYSTKQIHLIPDVKNPQMQNKNEKFKCNPEKNCKLNFAIKEEASLNDDVFLDNKIQVDSFNSAEEKTMLNNPDQSISNEKNYIEDNTKTNTNSNTPVSTSPVIACHKKSMNSIKNEIKLNDFTDNIDKCIENLDTTILNTQQKKKESIININQSFNFDPAQQKVNENMNLNYLNVNGGKNNLSSQSKLNSGNITCVNSLNTTVKFEDKVLRSVNSHSKNISNRNKNSDSFFLNKFSQNSNSANTNNFHVTPTLESFPQTNQRHSVSSTFNYISRPIDVGHLPRSQQNFPVFPNLIPNPLKQNNIQFANMNQFQPYPHSINNNFDLMNANNIFSNTPVYLDNQFNKFQNANPDYVLNNDLNPFTNYHTNFSGLNNNVQNNIYQINSNLMNKPNQNNINSTNNFFLDNFQNPFVNSRNNTDNYINRPNYNTSSMVNSHFPQKKTHELKSVESLPNPTAPVVNNYINYLFNDENANNSILANEMKPERKLAFKVNINMQNSLLNNRIENFSNNKLEIQKSFKMNNAQADPLQTSIPNNCNTFQINQEKADSNHIDKSIAEQTYTIKRKNTETNVHKTSNGDATQAQYASEFETKYNPNRSQRNNQTNKLDQQTKLSSNANQSSSYAKTENYGFSNNENIEILKVVLMNVPGTTPLNDSRNLTFTVHKHDNLFESFHSFLNLNKIAMEFEFPILVNIFQAISTIYNLCNSKVSDSDEKSIKLLHSIWKNHCFLVSQKTLFNKKNENPYIEKILKNELEKMRSLNMHKDQDSIEKTDEYYFNGSNFKTEKDLIESIGVYNSSCSSEDLNDDIEENPELNVSRSLSCEGEYEYLDRMRYMNSMSLLNKSF